jgi:hypothetical protein
MRRVDVDVFDACMLAYDPNIKSEVLGIDDLVTFFTAMDIAKSMNEHPASVIK